MKQFILILIAALCSVNVAFGLETGYEYRYDAEYDSEIDEVLNQEEILSMCSENYLNRSAGFGIRAMSLGVNTGIIGPSLSCTIGSIFETYGVISVAPITPLSGAVGIKMGYPSFPLSPHLNVSSAFTPSLQSLSSQLKLGLDMVLIPAERIEISEYKGDSFSGFLGYIFLEVPFQIMLQVLAKGITMSMPVVFSFDLGIGFKHTPALKIYPAVEVSYSLFLVN